MCEDDSKKITNDGYKQIEEIGDIEFKEVVFA